ncbi:MAG: hypothetical protein HY279_02630 [Nitrospinae bacterium]|nr:hypothetical protein [Nitrospinota bacterium]
MNTLKNMANGYRDMTVEAVCNFRDVIEKLDLSKDEDLMKASRYAGRVMMEMDHYIRSKSLFYLVMREGN